MEKIKFLGEGMDLKGEGGIDGIDELEYKALLNALNEAKKKKKRDASYEKLGEKCDYSKSQIANFLKGNSPINEEVEKSLKDALDIQDETICKKRIELLMQTFFQSDNPEGWGEELDLMVEQLYDDNQAEYQQLESAAERQLDDMKKWFMDMDYKWCYCLDEYYALYEEAQIPDVLWGFVENYMSMESKDRQSLRMYMERFPVAIGSVYEQSKKVRSFLELGWQERSDIEEKAKNDLKQEGRKETYTTQEFEQIRRLEHWESFYDKVKNSTYSTGDYFHRRMRHLVSIEKEQWEIMHLFLMLGDGKGEDLSLWQEFFARIISKPAPTKGD